MPQDTLPQVINPDSGIAESRFRWLVRDILDLEPFVRDQAIFEELRRLKKYIAEIDAEKANRLAFGSRSSDAFEEGI